MTLLLSLIASYLVSDLSSPHFWVRERASEVPWPLLAAFVHADHPDKEVQMRRKKAVPHWYRVLQKDPWFLTAVANRNTMFEGIWLSDQYYRTRFYFTAHALGLGGSCWLSDPWWREAEPTEITESWCWQVLQELRKWE